MEDSQTRRNANFKTLLFTVQSEGQSKKSGKAAFITFETVNFKILSVFRLIFMQRILHFWGRKFYAKFYAEKSLSVGCFEIAAEKSRTPHFERHFRIFLSSKTLDLFRGILSAYKWCQNRSPLCLLSKFKSPFSWPGSMDLLEKLRNSRFLIQNWFKTLIVLGQKRPERDFGVWPFNFVFSVRFVFGTFIGIYIGYTLRINVRLRGLNFV